MSLSPYYKLLTLFFIISILFGKILRPESNLKHLEFLTKNNKHREYYEITSDGLEYNVKGPAEIKIFISFVSLRIAREGDNWELG